LEDTTTPLDTELRTLDLPSEIHVRDESRREILMRIVPWDVVASGRDGPEEWKRGALADVDPSRVVLQLEHENPPAGRGLALEERDDGAYLLVRASKTQRGDEILELAKDGVTRGVSVGYLDVPGGTELQMRSGRRTRVVHRADLRTISTTWRPTWEQAAVLAVRSQEPQGEPVTEVVPVSDPTDRIAAALEAFAANTAQSSSAQAEAMTALMERMAALEERSRRDIIIPGHAAEPRRASVDDWMAWAIRTLKGGPVSAQELRERALDDIVTTENPGLVPDAFVSEIIGQINEGRPFLASTRQIPAPDSGMAITVPVLTQRPTADVQSTEKTEIDSTALRATLRSFDAVTIAGGADVSVQMLRRADRSFSNLLRAELGEALARREDERALAVLFNSPTTPGTADIDPEALLIGEAWTNAIQNSGRAPDTIWLSSEAVGAFIDAKSDGTNAPLYSNLAGNLTVGGGVGGSISGLRPVYVPGLDGTDVDVMIGPSREFVWAEDGAITLEADNPTLAGRDIALVSILFFIPRNAAAFTTYDLGS
jgi:HK97 family phage major capsid protein